MEGGAARSWRTCSSTRCSGRGPLASNVFEATGFMRTLPELTRPDIQVVFQAARRNTNTFPFPLGHGFAISVVNLYPKSRGTRAPGERGSARRAAGGSATAQSSRRRRDDVARR